MPKTTGRLITLLLLSLLATAIVIIFKNYRSRLESSIENSTIETIRIFGISSETKTRSAATPPKKKKNIVVVSPLANEEWVIGRLHTIKWSPEAEVTGGIYLVNANTKQVIGWIISELGPRQTSYNWDTRLVFLGRYGGVKQEIGVGGYYLVIKFDNNLGEVKSGPISVIYSGQEKKIIQTIILKDFKFNPITISAQKGEQIIFINNDQVKHRILSSGFGPYNLQPGESGILETSVLNLGTYSFYSENYPSMSGVLMVK